MYTDISSKDGLWKYISRSDSLQHSWLIKLCKKIKNLTMMELSWQVILWNLVFYCFPTLSYLLITTKNSWVSKYLIWCTSFGHQLLPLEKTIFAYSAVFYCAYTACIKSRKRSCTAILPESTKTGLCKFGNLKFQCICQLQVQEKVSCQVHLLANILPLQPYRGNSTILQANSHIVKNNMYIFC